MTLTIIACLATCVNVAVFLLTLRVQRRTTRAFAADIATMELATARLAAVRVEYRATLCLNSGVSLLAELHNRLVQEGGDDHDADGMVSEFACEYNSLNLPYELRPFNGTWRLYVRATGAAATG